MRIGSPGNGRWAERSVKAWRSPVEAGDRPIEEWSPRWDVGRWVGRVIRPESLLGGGLLDLERLTVDPGPADAKQPGLEADAGLAGLLALLVGEGLRVEVAQGEADEDLVVALDGGLELQNDGLRLLARHPAFEVGVPGVVGTAPQGGHGDAQEGVALFRRHLPDAVDVTETAGEKIEVLGLLV